MMALNMLWLDAKLGEIWGVLPLIFVSWALSGNRHSSTSFGAKAISCGKVSSMSVTDIEESELGKRTDLKIYKNGCLGG